MNLPVPLTGTPSRGVPPTTASESCVFHGRAHSNLTGRLRALTLLPCAQLAQEISLDERHASPTQDIVGRGRVEVEIRLRET